VMGLMGWLVEYRLVRILHEEVGNNERQWQTHSHAMSLFIEPTTRTEVGCDDTARASRYSSQHLDLGDSWPPWWRKALHQSLPLCPWSGAEKTQCANKDCQVLHVMWRAANMRTKYSHQMFGQAVCRGPLVLTIGF
jgi:hypothetical protein